MHLNWLLNILLDDNIIKLKSFSYLVKYFSFNYIFLNIIVKHQVLNILFCTVKHDIKYSFLIYKSKYDDIKTCMYYRLRVLNYHLSLSFFTFSLSSQSK